MKIYHIPTLAVFTLAGLLGLLCVLSVNTVGASPLAGPLAAGTPVDVTNNPLNVELITPQPVTINALTPIPIVTTGILPVATVGVVPITVTLPITTYVMPLVANEDRDKGPVLWLIAFVFSKFMALTLFRIMKMSALEKIYIGIVTMIFVLVDVQVLYPLYQHDPSGNTWTQNVQSLWWVFWLLEVAIIPKLVEFLSHRIAE